MVPNPEAIAWYVKRSEYLPTFSATAYIRCISLHIRGGQLAGFSGAVLALAGANVDSFLGALHGAPRAKEISNYTSERFIQEPDLWRAHVRTIGGLLDAIELITTECDRAARAIRTAEYSFLTGLFSVGLALAMVLAEVAF